MSNCCAATAETSVPSGKRTCPLCGGEGVGVAWQTLLHHLARPWQRQGMNQPYYFCNTPDCEVVYFTDSGVTIGKQELRTVVGSKETAPAALLCYCFGVSRADAVDPVVRDFVVQQTKAGLCACTTRNPSGRCCLKDFPAPVAHSRD
ncbi:putative iron-sulfur cluster-binding metallochaperone [Sulfurivermis fontis]|uniref:putative iron-sulfur cluster-binding metallochaperone n=1 Tax=Sulfurivermis fontis TaxID=1972068 RepID=UPI00155906D3|nr:copper chaperone Copz family protein [Sulfurivermis fontis]